MRIMFVSILLCVLAHPSSTALAAEAARKPAAAGEFICADTFSGGNSKLTAAQDVASEVNRRCDLSRPVTVLNREAPTEIWKVIYAYCCFAK